MVTVAGVTGDKRGRSSATPQQGRDCAGFMAPGSQAILNPTSVGAQHIFTTDNPCFDSDNFQIVTVKVQDTI